MIRSIVRIL